MDNFRLGEQARLDNYKTAINNVKGKFAGLENANAQVQPEPIPTQVVQQQPQQMPAQPQMYEPSFLGPENVVPDGGGMTNQNAKVRVLTGPNSGYKPAPAHEETPVMENNYNPFAALRTDENSTMDSMGRNGISYVLSTILIVILIVLLVVVTLGMLKAFTI